MNDRTLVLAQIRAESRAHGLSAALHSARIAFAAGRVDAFDMPEILLALRTGSWSFFDEAAPIGADRAANIVRAA
jgi:hypothetical protein